MNLGGGLAQFCSHECLLAPHKTNKFTQKVSSFPKFLQITYDGEKFQRQILLLRPCPVSRQGSKHGPRLVYIYFLNLVTETTASGMFKYSYCLEETNDVPRCHPASHTTRNLSQVFLTPALVVSDVQYDLNEFCHCHIHCLVSSALYIRCDFFPSSYTDN